MLVYTSVGMSLSSWVKLIHESHKHWFQILNMASDKPLDLHVHVYNSPYICIKQRVFFFHSVARLSVQSCFCYIFYKLIHFNSPLISFFGSVNKRTIIY